MCWYGRDELYWMALLFRLMSLRMRMALGGGKKMGCIILALRVLLLRMYGVLIGNGKC